MKRKDLEKLLEKNGWHFKRNGGNHDIYYKDDQRETIPRHKETDDILKIIHPRGLK